LEVVVSLSQGRTAAAQCGLFTHKSVPVIFEPPCIYNVQGKSNEFKFCVAVSVLTFGNVCNKPINPLRRHITFRRYMVFGARIKLCWDRNMVIGRASECGQIREVINTALLASLFETLHDIRALLLVLLEN